MAPLAQRFHDRYPTRTGTDETLSPRLDPVVYGETGPLDSELLRQYETDGYVLLPGLLDRELIEEALTDLDRIADSPELLDTESHFVLEPDSTALRSIYAIHTISPVIRSLATHPKLVDRARQILGSDVYLHQTRFNQKPGFDGADFFWHSDFETWHAEDGMPAMRALTVVVALTENMPINGPLMIIPGSHRTFVACPGETPEANYLTSLSRQYAGLPSADALRTLTDAGGVVQCLAEPGTAIMFDVNTLHGSAGNITPYARKCLFVAFNSMENTLVEPFAAPAPRPLSIASREFIPVDELRDSDDAHRAVCGHRSTTS